MASLTTAMEQIDAEARQLDPAKVLLTIVAAIPFVVGWILGKVWLAVAWLCTAFVVGWRDARAPRPVKAADDEQ